jgi:hypothetical protein
VTLPNNEDFIFRPVLRGMLKAESLLDGSVDLAFIADLNDALDAQEENERRYNEARQSR